MNYKVGAPRVWASVCVCVCVCVCEREREREREIVLNFKIHIRRWVAFVVLNIFLTDF